MSFDAKIEEFDGSKRKEYDITGKCFIDYSVFVIHATVVAEPTRTHLENFKLHSRLTKIFKELRTQ